MMSARMILIVLMVAVGGVFSQIASADVIHLTNGSTIEVDAWRDVGDAIEFARGGGIIRISKAEIQRIDGKSTSQDLRMYSAPPSGSPSTAALDQPAAGNEMLDLLKQGEGLFAQSVLSSAEKVGAFRRLAEKWQALTVPEGFRDAHIRGRDAFQIAAEAYTAESEGSAPNIKERLDAAKAALQDVQERVKKAGGES